MTGRFLAAGLGLTVSLTALGQWLWPPAIPAVPVMGLMATAIELGCLRLLPAPGSDARSGFARAVAGGMLLRLLGVGAFAVAVGADRAHFPPLVTGLGFLGVLIPLLFLELVAIR